LQTEIVTRTVFIVESENKDIKLQEPSANSPTTFARESARASLVSIALKKALTRRWTRGSWAASSMAVATSRHPRLPLAPLVRSA